MIFVQGPGEVILSRKQTNWLPLAIPIELGVLWTPQKLTRWKNKKKAKINGKKTQPCPYMSSSGETRIQNLASQQPTLHTPADWMPAIEILTWKTYSTAVHMMSKHSTHLITLPKFDFNDIYTFIFVVFCWRCSGTGKWFRIQQRLVIFVWFHQDLVSHISQEPTFQQTEYPLNVRATEEWGMGILLEWCHSWEELWKRKAAYRMTLIPWCPISLRRREPRHQ